MKRFLIGLGGLVLFGFTCQWFGLAIESAVHGLVSPDIPVGLHGDGDVGFGYTTNLHHS